MAPWGCTSYAITTRRTGKNDKDNAHKFLHAVRHCDVIMFPLHSFSIDVSTKRRRIDISHIGGTKENPAKITQSVFHHRRFGGCVFSGLVSGRFTLRKSKKFIGVAEI